MARRPIGPVDTIWLNMDRPDNLMVIDTLVFLAGPADWDRVVAVVRERLLDRYPVFTQRPVMPLAHVGTPHWEDDPDFDLDRHLVRVTLDRGDDADLQRYVEERVPVPLDRDHPLWELHLVDGYRDGSVLFCRLHHALADGVALTRVLLSMTDPHARGTPPPRRPPRTGRDHPRTGGRGAVRGARGGAADGRRRRERRGRRDRHGPGRRDRRPAGGPPAVRPAPARRRVHPGQAHRCGRRQGCCSGRGAAHTRSAASPPRRSGWSGPRRSRSTT